MCLEVTKREVLFSVIIVALMLLIGFNVNSCIDHNINNMNKEYNQAIHIKDADMFDYCINTNVGNAFVEGTISANSPLRDSRIDKDFLQLKVTHERYTMHTRVVSNGKTSYTQIYWTWDNVGTDYYDVDKVIFNNKIFPISRFENLDWQGQGTYSTGFHLRDVIYGVENNQSGSVYTCLSEKDMGQAKFFKDCNAEEALERSVNSSIFWIVIFWMVWLALTAGVVYGFVYFENEWLK